jgi:hypothetical protein
MAALPEPDVKRANERVANASTPIACFTANLASAPEVLEGFTIHPILFAAVIGKPACMTMEAARLAHSLGHRFIVFNGSLKHLTSNIVFSPPAHVGRYTLPPLTLWGDEPPFYQ